MEQQSSVYLQFGNIKDGGRIKVRNYDGKVIGLIKVTPINASGVTNINPYVLSGALVNPPSYNTLRMEDGVVLGYYFLPNDMLVKFLPDEY